MNLVAFVYCENHKGARIQIVKIINLGLVVRVRFVAKCLAPQSLRSNFGSEPDNSDPAPMLVLKPLVTLGAGNFRGSAEKNRESDVCILVFRLK